MIAAVKDQDGIGLRRLGLVFNKRPQVRCAGLGIERAFRLIGMPHLESVIAIADLTKAIDDHLRAVGRAPAE